MKSTVISSLMGISAALLMVGCASSDYDSDDYAVTETETTTTTSGSDMTSGSEISEPSGAEPAQTAQAGDEVVIPLHEEQLNVGKRQVDSGEVTIRKVVTSEPVTQSVDLRKESLTIEREPAGAARESASAAPDARVPGIFEEDTFTIQLQEEQPVVEKRTVQTGQITARKNAQWEREQVQSDIRREDIQVDRSDDAARVTFEGDAKNVDISSGETIEEAAGAERPDASEEPKDY